MSRESAKLPQGEQKSPAGLNRLHEGNIKNRAQSACPVFLSLSFKEFALQNQKVNAAS